MTIDLHTHILPPGWPDLGERCPRFERIDAHTARIVVAGRNAATSPISAGTPTAGWPTWSGTGSSAR